MAFLCPLKVQVYEGAINGIRMRFIDTPGLQAAASAVGYNSRVLGQIRKAYKKYKPDNVLYFDRMDVVSRPAHPMSTIRFLFGLHARRDCPCMAWRT
jgi:hypothetical protein